ncbi:MAG: ABC transporter ATP-binding protein [Oscillospiraceae bacterium]|nr:ABC transporter ATP-binding protein [Oscillospiraceae bacterium]
MGVAEIRGLCKEYPAFKLRDVSFDLNSGRISGFIGRNGAGKTTTIKSILNLVHPSDGEIRYFGLPLLGNEAEIKKRIGYSTGAVNYYPRKKLRDVAAVTRSFYPNWDEAAYEEYLKLFRLDEQKSPSELSEGMKVKCNLLLALSHGAEILILDEPTSGLDPFSRDELTDIFLMLKERGTAVLFSTHITSDLEKCADDIIYIREGRMIAASTVEAFRGYYSNYGDTLEAIMLRLEREARYA